MVLLLLLGVSVLGLTLVERRALGPLVLVGPAVEGVWVPLAGDVASTPELAVEALERRYGRRSDDFADYLARVLLSYDDFARRWWKAQKKEAPAFEAFVASLKLSLARREDPREVLSALASRDEFARAPPRRHLAVAFSLIDADTQPVAEIKKLLLETENRSVSAVRVVDGGFGYEEDANYAVSVDGTTVGLAFAEEGRISRVDVFDNVFVQTVDPVLFVEGNATLRAELTPTFAFAPGRSVAPFFVQVSNSTDPVFRPLKRRYDAPEFASLSPAPLSLFIELDRQPSPVQYVEIGLCGAVCASSSHLALTPIEFAKTRRQVEADFDWDGAFSGWDAIVLGHFLSGAAGFGLTAFIKNQLAFPFAVVVASLAASVVSTVVVAPFEAARVKEMAAYPDQRISLRDAWRLDYGSLDALLLKDLSFAVVKFSAFDAVSDFLYQTYPVLKQTLTASLFTSVLAGTVAGVLAAVVSQPADAAFTRMEAPASELRGVFNALRAVYRVDGLRSLYAGTIERAIFAGSLIAAEFVIYEGLRDFLHLSKDDFVYSLDVLASAIGALPPPPTL
ncbi:hypothetical protein CTAYLR_005676 [Chrysophaeum taylorii]|uniref:Uncharacterized protein n=1 Tax=Chrysophaeum taylorii TaxID=2483200 RepID=A0AAD7UKW6_9STRA|nr:hypothetical protein CTAYLR_005676 [Chrysophaeum taylorii]